VCLEACGVAAVVGFAGCQNLDAAVDGDVIETVDGLAVNDHSDDEDDRNFEVEIDIENTGGETSTLGNYDFTIVPYDESDTDVTGEGGSTEFDTDPLPAGETTDVEVEVGTSLHPSDVERYEIGITCSEFAENAAYCGS
jgi:hypothetical protein